MPKFRPTFLITSLLSITSVLFSVSAPTMAPDLEWQIGCERFFLGSHGSALEAFNRAYNNLSAEDGSVWQQMCNAVDSLFVGNKKRLKIRLLLSKAACEKKVGEPEKALCSYYEAKRLLGKDLENHIILRDMASCQHKLGLVSSSSETLKTACTNSWNCPLVFVGTRMLVMVPSSPLFNSFDKETKSFIARTKGACSSNINNATVDFSPARFTFVSSLDNNNEFKSSLGKLSSWLTYPAPLPCRLIVVRDNATWFCRWNDSLILSSKGSFKAAESVLRSAIVELNREIYSCTNAIAIIPLKISMICMRTDLWKLLELMNKETEALSEKIEILIGINELPSDYEFYYPKYSILTQALFENQEKTPHIIVKHLTNEKTITRKGNYTPRYYTTHNQLCIESYSKQWSCQLMRFLKMTEELGFLPHCLTGSFMDPLHSIIFPICDSSEDLKIFFNGLLKSSYDLSPAYAVRKYTGSEWKHRDLVDLLVPIADLMIS